MNNFKRIIPLIIILLTVTGCVKMEVSMDIKKDKSMTLGIIQAIDKSLMEQSGNSSSMMDEEEKRELEEDGYKVEEYTEDDMTGYRITKEIKNIDKVSTKDEITANLGTDELSNNDYIFTVKKGLFKNTYKATLKNSDADEINDSLDSGLQDNNSEDDNLDNEIGLEDNDDFSTDEEYTEDDNIDIDTNDNLGDFDYSTLLSNMEVVMKVNLPYKALSSNATNIENDGTTLTWDFMKFKEDTIQFEFELYNTSNIIITSVGIILVIVLIIMILIKSKKKKQTNNNIVEQTNPESQHATTVENNQVQTNTIVPNHEQQPSNIEPAQTNPQTLVDNTKEVTSNMNENSAIITPNSTNIFESSIQNIETKPMQTPNIFEQQSINTSNFTSDQQPSQSIDSLNQTIQPQVLPITNETPQSIENKEIQPNTTIPTLEPMPQPLKLEQVSNTQNIIEQPQIETNVAQNNNVETTTSQYDSILQQNTDK